MSFSGASVQNAIYIAQQPPEWPIGPEDWERAAEEKLDAGAFGYIAGGAGGESTLRANLAAFDRWRIRPRMLTGNMQRDISVDILGTHSPSPFLFAPLGVLSIASEEGEVGVARAAASSKVPMIVSSAATHSLEQIAETGCPRWFQLYWVSDRDICASFVSRAEEAGYGAIVVTLDTLTLGWRPPWFDTITPSMPCSSASRASSAVSTPFTSNGSSVRARSQSRSSHVSPMFENVASIVAAAVSGSSAGGRSSFDRNTGSLKNCPQPSQLNWGQ